MGHHCNKFGEFKSDKYPDLGPDKIVVSFKHPEAWASLEALAEGYREIDPELSEDILERLRAIKIEVYECECRRPVATGLYFYPGCPDCAGTGKPASGSGRGEQ